MMDDGSEDWSGADGGPHDSGEDARRSRRRMADPSESGAGGDGDDPGVATLHYGEEHDAQGPRRAPASPEANADGEAQGSAADGGGGESGSSGASAGSGDAAAASSGGRAAGGQAAGGPGRFEADGTTEAAPAGGDSRPEGDPGSEPAPRAVSPAAAAPSHMEPSGAQAADGGPEPEDEPRGEDVAADDESPSVDDVDDPADEPEPEPEPEREPVPDRREDDESVDVDERETPGDVSEPRPPEDETPDVDRDPDGGGRPEPPGEETPTAPLDDTGVRDDEGAGDARPEGGAAPREPHPPAPDAGEGTERTSPENRAPTALHLDGDSVSENAAGAVVGRLSAVDADQAGGHAFIVSDDRFEVVDGELRLRDGQALDHETEPRVVLEVTAVDDDGARTNETFEIAVADANDAPDAIRLDGVGVAENDAGAVVGRLAVADADADDTHAFRVSDDRFEIVEGELRLKEGVSLDHEAEPTITLEAAATDAAGETVSQSFEIAVANANEAPTGLDLRPRVTITEAPPPRFGEEVQLTVRLGGEAYRGDPNYEIVVDGQVVARGAVTWSRDTEAYGNYANSGPNGDVDNDQVEWRDVSVTIPTPEGGFGSVEVRYPNDAYNPGVGDRNLIVDHIRIDDEIIEAESDDVRYEGGKYEDGGGAERLPWRGALKFDTQALFDAPAVHPAGATPEVYAGVAGGEAGAVIGFVQVSDPDAGDVHQFTLSDDRFEIVGGELRLRDGVALDPEADGRLTLDVTATDAGGLSATQSFEIAVMAPPTVAVGSGFRAEYFDFDDRIEALAEVDWAAPPDFQELVGEVDYRNSDGSFWRDGARDTFAARITGNVSVKTGGSHEFFLGGDDGAALYVDGALVVSNDGDHGFRTKSARIDLTEGDHLIEVRYFENFGQAGLKLEWEGPGIDGRALVAAQPPGDLSTFDGVALNLSFDVTPPAGEPGAATALSLDGLPTGTVVAGGGRSAVIGEDGALDLTGWDVAALSVTPPLGVAGPVTAMLHAVTTFENGLVVASDETIAFDVSPLPDFGAASVSVSTGFGIDFFDFEDRLSSLDDFDWSADPDHQEVVSAIDYKAGADTFWEGGAKDTYAARATGAVTVEEGGVFTFRLGADDGAALYVDGERVVNHDGDHGYSSRTGQIELPPGEHEIEIRYFENFGVTGLKLEWEGPGTDGFELVRPNADLGVEDGGTLAVNLGVRPHPGEVESVRIGSLPPDTILMSGDDAAVAGDGPLDVTGWNLDHLEITPPPGFSGALRFEVQVTGRALNGAERTNTEAFEIEVGLGESAPDGPSGGGAHAAGPAGAGDERSWTEMSDDDRADGQDAAPDDDVMSEDVHGAGGEESQVESFDTYERADY